MNESNFAATNSAPREPWLFWGTIGWGLLAIVFWQVLIIPVIAYMIGGMDQAEFEKYARGADGIAVTLWLAVPAHLAVLAWAIRIKRWGFADYLALYMPSRFYLFVGLAILAILLPLGDLTSWLAGRPIIPDFMINIYRSGRETGTFWIAATAIVIAAPIFEEVLFRGFMFRGLSVSRLGITGAIVVPSLIWAAMHIQYELFNIVQIFVIGCVFAWVRWVSGTTLLTVFMHMGVNAAAVIQAVWWVESSVAG
ncbi:CAAX amino terminal protease self- immunity [Variibacter gotjawalensis]|uniref:CAAX amino terminal protease self-immunity n=1 Tax=Variibacter gotjawalensis TaxID=1333996 RepID=A0A0S3PWK5_9BRAD|nr:CPBP family intramembrane glutamic endopeptidase [Variibacter gotjawalensis]NIK46085.1 hypothetical protein [Variibacter gotjawalensis]RZS48004.1 hypothetical protein EV661_0399 [Variibacter gotjawalensis]BAT60260.1 CAAX amino terminal protease self- immunity [Variibacter gotjawalensis]